MDKSRKNRSTLERAIGSALLIAIGLGVVYRKTLMPYLEQILLGLVIVVVVAIILVLNWRNRQHRLGQKAARDSYRAEEQEMQEAKRDP